MRLLKTFKGVGELQVGTKGWPATYTLDVMQDRRGIGGQGNLDAEFGALQAAFDAGKAYLVLSGGDAQVEIVINRWSPGRSASFLTSGEIPGV
jgi:hypothetical protein